MSKISKTASAFYTVILALPIYLIASLTWVLPQATPPLHVALLIDEDQEEAFVSAFNKNPLMTSSKHQFRDIPELQDKTLLDQYELHWPRVFDISFEDSKVTQELTLERQEALKSLPGVLKIIPMPPIEAKRSFLSPDQWLALVLLTVLLFCSIIERRISMDRSRREILTMLGATPLALFIEQAKQSLFYLLSASALASLLLFLKSILWL